MDRFWKGESSWDDVFQNNMMNLEFVAHENVSNSEGNLADYRSDTHINYDEINTAVEPDLLTNECYSNIHSTGTNVVLNDLIGKGEDCEYGMDRFWKGKYSWDDVFQNNMMNFEFEAYGNVSNSEGNHADHKSDAHTICDEINTAVEPNLSTIEYYPDINSTSSDVVSNDLICNSKWEDIRDEFFYDDFLGQVDFFGLEVSSNNCNYQNECEDVIQDLNDLKCTDSGFLLLDTAENPILKKEEEIFNDDLLSETSWKKQCVKKISRKMCSKSFTQTDSLKEHGKVHSGKKPFLCNICYKSFSRSYHLKRHVKIHIRNESFQCNICLKFFTRSTRLESHQNIHTDENPFCCKICSKSFTRNNNLKTPETKHTEEKQLLREICSNSFIKISDLKNHEKNHTDEKPFQCKFCSESFICSFSLKQHEESHTEEGEFQCKICSKSFTQSASLKGHEKLHTGEKLFYCKIRQNNGSRNHEKAHTKEKRFPCKVCFKSFDYNSHLKRHEKIHFREGSFQCKTCLKFFNKKAKLESHEKIHTGKNFSL